MKRVWFIALSVLLLFALAACGNQAQIDLPEASLEENTSGFAPETPVVSDSIEMTEEPPAEGGEAKIELSFDGGTITATLYDNPTANDFLSMLPLTLTFEDFNATEKIAYLPRTLSMDGAPDSFDPDVGDLAIYAPWGNLSLFYKDFRVSSGLVSIGRIEEGADLLESLSGTVTITKSES